MDKQGTSIRETAAIFNIPSHETVRRLMISIGLKCIVQMRKYRSYRGTVGKFAPNILKRQFHASHN